MYRNIQNSPSPQHHPTPSPPLDYGPGSWQVPGPSNAVPYQQNAFVPPPEQPNNNFNFIDMDNNQPLAQLNSAELCGLLEGAYHTYQHVRPENERFNLDQENMTDSFTKLTTNAINELTGCNEFPK
jgi:hypothetical protein